MQRLALSLFAAAALAVSTGCSDELHSTHSHAHDSHDTPGVLTLDNGSKWTTDEALRHGMNGIHQLVIPYRADGGDLPALTQGVQSNIEYMVKNCQLEPKADAALHIILGELFEGIALLDADKDEAQHTQGIARLVHALEQYGQHFDHPGWETMHAGH